MTLEIELNGKRIAHKTKVFSGGEVQVKLELDQYKGRKYSNIHEIHPMITAYLKSPADLIELLMATAALRSFFGECPISLAMPYVPYARQDRVMSDGEALSIKVLARLINSQNYEEVVICDPHSDVTTALINNVRVIEQWQYLGEIIRPKLKHFVLVAPDGGALKKVIKAGKKYSEEIAGIVRADKTRDVVTGAITDTIVYSEHIGDLSFLILDDICDGGRTFNDLAAKLKPLTNGQIHLFVTHGIFAYGFDKLRENIDRIWVGHSFVDLDPVADFVKLVAPQ